MEIGTEEGADDRVEIPTYLTKLDKLKPFRLSLSLSGHLFRVYSTGLVQNFVFLLVCIIFCSHFL